jgi:hypothetical protein
MSKLSVTQWIMIGQLFLRLKFEIKNLVRRWRGQEPLRYGPKKPETLRDKHRGK